MSWIKMILEILPVVIEAVKAVEKAIGGGKGDVKKKLVMNAIEAGRPAGDKTDTGAVSVLVDSVVGSLNATGALSGKVKGA